MRLIFGRTMPGFGKEQTQWVLEHHPEMLVWISKPGLRYLPVQVIPLLLEKAQGDKRELHSTIDHPLRIIQTWVNQEYGNFPSAKQKRSLLLAAITDWFPKQTELFSMFRAIHVALLFLLWTLAHWIQPEIA